MDTEITIERTPDIVWDYFTKPENWEKWWGGGVKAAQWCEGGRVEWALGGSSAISAFTPGKRVQIAGGWMPTTFTFEPGRSGTTVVGIHEGAPQGGASFSDGGGAHMRQLEASLAKLKDHVERETPRGAGPSTATATYVCPHCGSGLQGDALITVTVSMQVGVVDFKTACSSCNKVITKQDMDNASRKGAPSTPRSKSPAAAQTKKWWEFWK